MTEPDVIVRHAARLMRKSAAWSGRRVVVTAGPTREAIDPVRVVTNRSSGKMGYRIAEAAWFRGAEVTLLAGPGAEPDPDGVTVERIESTAELDAAVRRHLPAADVLVMAAAPADYRPVAPTDQKRPREQGTLTLEFEPTADILLGTKAVRKPGALIVGFALETGDAVAKAAAKLARKGLDLIVANDATEPGAGFEVDTNRVTLVDRDGGNSLFRCSRRVLWRRQSWMQSRCGLDELRRRYLRQQVELGGPDLVASMPLSDLLARPARGVQPSLPSSPEEGEPARPLPRSRRVPGPRRRRAPQPAGAAGVRDWRVGAPPIPGPGLVIEPPLLGTTPAD